MEYGIDALLEVLSGKRTHAPHTKNNHQPDPPKVNLMVDIQAKPRDGKGAGYARWASTFNLKQMAHIPLFDALDVAALSAEDLLMSAILEAERIEYRTSLLEQVFARLTHTQHRRLWMYYVDGLTEAEIANQERVGQQRISASLISGKRAKKFFLGNFFIPRGKTAHLNVLSEGRIFPVLLQLNKWYCRYKTRERAIKERRRDDCLTVGGETRQAIQRSTHP